MERPSPSTTYFENSLDAFQSQRPQTDEDMITSIHTLIYSDDANATRAFLRDVLGWKYVTEDFDNDWLIFKSGSSEMGVHPTHGEWEGQTYDRPRHHLIALMCDNIEATVGELCTKGAQFRGPIEQLEYGRVHIGTHVLITLRKIHDFVKPEEPDLLAKTD